MAETPVAIVEALSTRPSVQIVARSKFLPSKDTSKDQAFEVASYPGVPLVLNDAAEFCVYNFATVRTNPSGPACVLMI